MEKESTGRYRGAQGGLVVVVVMLAWVKLGGGIHKEALPPTTVSEPTGKNPNTFPKKMPHNFPKTSIGPWDTDIAHVADPWMVPHMYHKIAAGMRQHQDSQHPSARSNGWRGLDLTCH